MTASPIALLVTGSRSLASGRRLDSASRKEAWARAILKATIDALPPESTLIHGGATGPDAWAQEAIDARRYELGYLLYAHTYAADGRRWVWSIGDGDEWWSQDRWHPADPGPLARNRHMVEVALPALAASGHAPRVLALVDPASRTKGTDHTVRLALKAGYPVDRREYAP